VIFSADEKRAMVERLDELMWGSRQPISGVAVSRVVLNRETLRAIAPLWGDRFKPRDPKALESNGRHEDGSAILQDFMGQLSGPREGCQVWQVFVGSYAEPTSVHFRVPLREYDEAGIL
jgi:hypothetical protein